jgi:hypothetical protein
MGRPRGLPKTNVNVRVTRAEYDALEAMAVGTGDTVSGVARRLIAAAVDPAPAHGRTYAFMLRRWARRTYDEAEVLEVAVRGPDAAASRKLLEGRLAREDVQEALRRRLWSKEYRELVSGPGALSAEIAADIPVVDVTGTAAAADFTENDPKPPETP